MFGYQCIGYGIQNAGWNHNWMYPGPCFAPMGHYGGYNPRVSDGVMIGQTVFSAIDGIIAGLNAHYNHGADGFTSAGVALGTAAVGTNNAFLGNVIDKNTGTYFGSMTNSILSTFTNPFFANMNLTAGAFMTSPFMNPFASPVGMYGWHHGHHGFHCYC